ncbi:MAG TPA: hypothetical protein VHD85_02920 [Terracidiphilus sp.]|nr:hypothetical protein [Terracidiphilus sp.]
MTTKSTPQKVCPECGYQFKGNGFDGIDAHWCAKHESRMPYHIAWPQIKSGTYRRRTGSIEAFCGSLAKGNKIKLTIEEIKEFTERALAGER